jgi:hypothetical protein
LFFLRKGRPVRPGIIFTLLLFLITGIILYSSFDFLPGDINFFLLWLEPNYSYANEANDLFESGHLQEALEMAGYIKNNPELPGQELADEVYGKAEAELDKRNSLLGKAKRGLEGFVFGDAEDAYELGGSVVGDLFLWGDIRDLTVNSYRKAVGSEKGDYFIMAVSSVGIATTLIPKFDIFASVTKNLRKIGALSAKFADEIITIVKKIAKLGDEGKFAVKQLSGAASDVKVLSDKMSFGRIAKIFKFVDSVDDVNVIAKFASAAPDATFLCVRNGGLDTIKVLEPTASNIKLLNLAAAKGPAGFERLAKTSKSGSLLIIKDFYKGRSVILDEVTGKISSFLQSRPYPTRIVILVACLLFFIYSILRFPLYLWRKSRWKEPQGEMIK